MTQRVVILAVRVDVSSFASSNRSIQTLSVNNERLQGELEDLSSFVYCQFGSSHRNSQFHARCGLNRYPFQYHLSERWWALCFPEIWCCPPPCHILLSW